MQRSFKEFQTAVELVRNGRIGKLKQVWVALPYYSTKGGPFAKQPVPPQLDWDMYQGQAPVHDYCLERTVANFRWWYEYAGGIITDWGNHHVDIAHWGMDCDLTGPTSVEARGLFPNPEGPEYYNTPDRFFSRMMYPNGVELLLLLVDQRAGAIRRRRRPRGRPRPSRSSGSSARTCPRRSRATTATASCSSASKGKVFVNRGARAWQGGRRTQAEPAAGRRLARLSEHRPHGQLLRLRQDPQAAVYAGASRAPLDHRLPPDEHLDPAEAEAHLGSRRSSRSSATTKPTPAKSASSGRRTSFADKPHRRRNASATPRPRAVWLGLARAAPMRRFAARNTCHHPSRRKPCVVKSVSALSQRVSCGACRPGAIAVRAKEFNGLNMNLGNLHRLSNAESRSISAENFTGEKGKGGHGHRRLRQERRPRTGPRLEGLALPSTSRPSPPSPSPTSTARARSSRSGSRPAPIDKTRLYILRFYWDGETEPSVEVPLGDFFACGWGKYCQINSLPVCVNPGSAFNCYWTMPFRKKAKITLENLDDKDMVLYYQVNYTLTDVPDDAAYFHAQFRRTREAAGQDRLHDPRRRRRAAGNTSARTWPGNRAVPAGGARAKSSSIFDGDKEFPTICGTGTEDYFCGSYCFMHPETGLYAPVQHALRRHAAGVAARHDRRPAATFRPLPLAHHRPVRFEKDMKVTMQALGWKDNGAYLPLGRRHRLGGLLVSDRAARQVPRVARQGRPDRRAA